MTTEPHTNPTLADIERFFAGSLTEEELVARVSARAIRSNLEGADSMPTPTVTRTELYDLISSAFVKPPTTIETMRETAQKNGAREAVLDELAKVPDGERFFAIRDIWRYFPDMPPGE